MGVIMLPVLNNLDSLRTSPYCWDNYDSEHFHVFPMKSAAGATENPEYLVPYSLLSTLDSRLPVALRAQLLATNKNFGLRFATTREVFATIDYYVQGAVEFDDVLDIPRSIHKITEFYEPQHYPGQYRFQGVLLTLESVEAQGGDAVFVVDSERRIVTAWESELEERYPGFKKRYDLGLELSIEFSDLIDHVFPVVPKNNVVYDIGTISFE